MLSGFARFWHLKLIKSLRNRAISSGSVQYIVTPKYLIKRAIIFQEHSMLPFKQTTQRRFTFIIPVHVTPFPVNPVLQAQVKEPTVFVHVASA